MLPNDMEYWTLRVRSILDEVGFERNRQETLKEEGRFYHTCADLIPNTERYLYLSREMGEVAEKIYAPSDRREKFVKLTREQLREELIQVAAVAIAWVEGLDKEAGR